MAGSKKQITSVVMKGDFNPIDIVLHGSTADVERPCKELLKKCGPSGRFKLAPGCCIPSMAPLENIKPL